MQWIEELGLGVWNLDSIDDRAKGLCGGRGKCSSSLSSSWRAGSKNHIASKTMTGTGYVPTVAASMDSEHLVLHSDGDLFVLTMQQGPLW
jgi:hypothetical protein